jgi:4-oxalocrotonate tautomerase
MPYINIKVTGGVEAPTTEQKEALIKGVTDMIARVLNKNPATTVVIIDEVPMENWGVGGESIPVRRKKAQGAS